MSSSSEKNDVEKQEERTLSWMRSDFYICVYIQIYIHTMFASTAEIRAVTL